MFKIELVKGKEASTKVLVVKSKDRYVAQEFLCPLMDKEALASSLERMAKIIRDTL